jgi:MFS family permease
VTHATRWLEPWFSAYALAGLLVNGIVPLLIPLTTEKRGPTITGLVVASFFVGQLSAPMIGAMADRTGRQRQVFLGSFPLMALGAVGFGLADGPAPWMLSAVLAGAAAGAAQTIGSVFIVEGHPRSEWDMRIGWFLGQVAGLGIGAVFAERHVDLGWYLAAAAIANGWFLGRLRLPRLRPQNLTPPVGSTDSTGLAAELRGRFGRFLATWLLAMIAVQTILNVMPLVMRDAFTVRPSMTASVYLVGSLAGALLYPVCGAAAHRIGSGRVLGVGMLTTLLAFAVMTLAWLTHTSGWQASVVALLLIALAYPLNYIGGTMLAAELATDGEGSAMGLFNSAVAVGAIVGAVVPSFMARAFGYGSLPPLAAAVMTVALLLGAPLVLHRRVIPPRSAAS